MNKSFGLHLENWCWKETNGFLKLTSLMKTQIEHKAEYEKLYHKPYSFDKSEVTKNNDIINNYNGKFNDCFIMKTTLTEYFVKTSLLFSYVNLYPRYDGRLFKIISYLLLVFLIHEKLTIPYR